MGTGRRRTLLLPRNRVGGPEKMTLTQAMQLALRIAQGTDHHLEQAVGECEGRDDHAGAADGNTEFAGDLRQQRVAYPQVGGADETREGQQHDGPHREIAGGTVALAVGRADRFLLSLVLTAGALRSARMLPIAALLLLPLAAASITEVLPVFFDRSASWRPVLAFLTPARWTLGGGKVVTIG